MGNILVRVMLGLFLWGNGRECSCVDIMTDGDILVRGMMGLFFWGMVGKFLWGNGRNILVRI